jgi:hypothetical protein
MKDILPPRALPPRPISGNATVPYYEMGSSVIPLSPILS